MRIARPLDHQVAPPPVLITAGVIASELGEPMHRVVRVLATRPWIKPAALASRVRLFDRRAIEQVRAELAGIDRRRAPLGHGGAA
ncbi:MAG: hypothetical protein JNM07_13440 [Phycisphaerae bacterium]|nr:hypothetical protein [Phycisphaerae bacterium]